jgi:dihydroorotase-like cyclic amidohydrolase
VAQSSQGTPSDDFAWTFSFPLENDTFADALVIDGKGLTVYAGFIDAMSSWGFDAAQRRSAIGMPANEDFASEALAATAGAV